jgi:hypothetical protein
MTLVESMPALPDTAVRATEMANDPNGQMPQAVLEERAA